MFLVPVLLFRRYALTTLSIIGLSNPYSWNYINRNRPFWCIIIVSVDSMYIRYFVYSCTLKATKFLFFFCPYRILLEILWLNKDGRIYYKVLFFGYSFSFIFMHARSIIYTYIYVYILQAPNCRYHPWLFPLISIVILDRD